MSLKITFLGTGTSQGVPMIGCNCSVCLSPHPGNKRFRSSILVESDGLCLVVDTTPDFRTQCLRAGVSNLDAILYTHEHADHLVGLDDLRRICILHDKRLPVYGSATVLEYIQRMFPYALQNPAPFKGLPELDLHEINGPFQIGHLRITPFQMPHGRTQSLGFRFEDGKGSSFAYLTDCKEVAPEIRNTLKGIPLLILDALRKKPHPTHLSLDEALAVADDIRPGQTWFTHVCHDLDHPAINSELPAGTALAHDTLVLEV